MQQLDMTDLSILLLEPSTAQNKIIVNNLNDHGLYEVDSVFSIDEARNKLEEYKPNLLISSMYFEEGPITDFLYEIRSNPEYEDIPFMLISSERRIEQLEPIKQAGVVAILKKPFTTEALERAMRATVDYIEADDLFVNECDVATLNVLVVDDSLMARKHLVRILENLGAKNITTAEDGAEAIKIIDKNTFDLVVTDHNMPNIDGAELVKYIRLDSSQPDIPILVVTSEQNSATLSSIEQNGCSALCDKPFDTQYVKSLLRHIL